MVCCTVLVYNYSATQNINSPGKLINTVKEKRNVYMQKQEDLYQVGNASGQKKISFEKKVKKIR